MANKYTLTKEQLEAIHSLSDSELERLHKESVERLNNMDFEATHLIKQANMAVQEDPTNDLFNKIVMAAKGFQIAQEGEKQWRAINIEAFNELNLRNLRKQRDHEK